MEIGSAKGAILEGSGDTDNISQFSVFERRK
jgi:hypothetical protein